jgi:hypothetical protein
MHLEKAIKLFMIHLGNEEVRDQFEICPGLRYAFVKVTDGTMTATKAHGAGLRKRSLTNASLRTRVPDANRTDKLAHREHLSARALCYSPPLCFAYFTRFQTILLDTPIDDTVISCAEFIPGDAKSLFSINLPPIREKAARCNSILFP